jgi:hypothetical protein
MSYVSFIIKIIYLVIEIVIIIKYSLYYKLLNIINEFIIN